MYSIFLHKNLENVKISLKVYYMEKQFPKALNKLLIITKDIEHDS